MIFEEQVSRKPDHYPWTKEFIKAMHDGFWVDSDFTFQSDIHDFKVMLSDKEREIIKRCLSAIGQVEIAVKKFWAKLGDNLPHPSITDLGYVMANVEVIHNNAYERLLSVLELEQIFEDNLKIDVVMGRVNYLKKYNHKFYENSKKQYIYALILFTLFIENVSLFSQFYIVLWFGRYKNVLKDTTQQVFYTKNEEMIHALVGIKLVNVIREEYPHLFDAELENKIVSEARAAFESESKIVDWMLEDFNEPRLNAATLKTYIKNRINESMAQIGFPKVFDDIDQKLLEDCLWMEETVVGNNQTDFFHRKDVGYSKKTTAVDPDDLF